MKTYIDLLPEGKREEIQKEKNLRTIIAQELNLTFSVAVLVVILLVINLVLKIQLDGTDKFYQNSQSLKGAEELKTYEEKFKSANASLDLVLKVRENNLDWVGALTKLSQLFPEGVYLNGIATRDYRLFLIGQARKREDLLALQEALKNSACFSNLNAPLSNLVAKENVDFQIDFDINKNCLKVQ